MLTTSPRLTSYAPSAPQPTTSVVTTQRPSTTFHSPRTKRKTSTPASPLKSAHRISDPIPRPQSQPLLRSPKRPTSDAATQYTPPDWPPTISGPVARPTQVPIRRQPSAKVQPRPVTAPSTPPKVADEEIPSEHPPEPLLRKTPQTTFSQNHAISSRGESPAVAEDGANQPSAKRRRPPDQEVRVLPKDYAQCPPKTLAILISGLLMDLINHNDNIKLEDNNLTRFHSRTPPGISVYDYLQRLTFHATLNSPVLLAMVFYIDRLCAAFPIFTINSLTVHRFLITAVTVAAKGLCDVFWTNSLYAKVGGVSLKELALLELELLSKVEWRIIPETEKLADYYTSVVARHPDYVLEGQQDDDEGEGSSASSSSAAESDSIEMDGRDGAAADE